MDLVNQQLSDGTLQLQQLLPHRDPMLLLDRLLHCDEESCRVALTIGQNSPFYDQALAAVPAWVGIEYMAQTIAVWSGYHRRSQGKPILVGFLLGTRRYHCEQPLFTEHQRLEISVNMRYVEDGGLAAFDCRINNNEGILLASAAVNAFRPDDPEQFVRCRQATITGETK